jgi:hypothetical protein
VSREKRKFCEKSGNNFTLMDRDSFCYQSNRSTQGASADLLLQAPAKRSFTNSASVPAPGRSRPQALQPARVQAEKRKEFSRTSQFTSQAEITANHIPSQPRIFGGTI